MQNPMIQQTLQAEQVFMETPELINQYELAEKYRRDRAARESYVFEEGFTQGHEEGRNEERILIAGNLLSSGMPVDKVAAMTGLSMEEVSRFQ